MFERDSRYHDLETAMWGEEGARKVPYKRRRFLPQGRTLPVLAQLEVEEPGRLDLLADRALGNPRAFWRICDAEDALDPAELADTPGRRLRVPVPEGGA